MIRHIAIAGAFGLLIGCGDGQPFTFGSSTPTTPVPGGGGVTPDTVSVNLYAFSYNPAGAGTLSLDVRSLDAGSVNAAYSRVPLRDIAGYRAFEYQQDANNRKFLAYVATAASGSVSAVAVADGGQFNRYFGGGQFVQNTTYSAPASGVVTYAGDYAGVITIDTSGNAVSNPTIYPNQPSAVQGEVVFIGDFTNGAVNGAIYNRVIISEDGVTVLPASYDLVDLVLTETPLASDGSFAGGIQEQGDPNSNFGSYAGTFGGVGATDVAGVVFIVPYGTPGTWEHGVFVLPTCNAACPVP